VTVSVPDAASYWRCFVGLYKMVVESLPALLMTMKCEDHFFRINNALKITFQNNSEDFWSKILSPVNKVCHQPLYDSFFKFINQYVEWFVAIIAGGLIKHMPNDNF